MKYLLHLREGGKEYQSEIYHCLYNVLYMVCLGNRYRQHLYGLNCSFHSHCLGMTKKKKLKSELKTFTSKFYCIILVVKFQCMHMLDIHSVQNNQYITT